VSSCPHTVYTTGPARPFHGSVRPARPNQAAHGGVVYRDRCVACSAERDRLRNQGHEEAGPWRPGNQGPLT
jgi:cytochrome c